MTKFITRFAPSPTGGLHLGHAYAALCVHDAARAASGRFLLRIEDIDASRCKREYEAAIHEDLAWLGLEWEKPVRRQSEHLADYQSALDRLIEAGLVYRCFRTRKEVMAEIASAPHLAAEGPEGPVFTGKPLAPSREAKLLEEGKPYAWRLSMAACADYLGSRFAALDWCEESLDPPHVCKRVAARPEVFGDVVIARKDAGTSYHLAAVHDDALQGITHVIRGADLRAAAGLHRLLQTLLGYPEPVYRHHPLLTGPDGKRYAKRDRSVTLAHLRQSGLEPADICRLIAEHLG
ncbi:MAG: tRNA glutamyl-Q(34) synthetase GluQRS [Caulobacterales bacterium]|uniref:tRNA glutamyl-Q(34) synthetase GluQRS n=1 Tax=Glycocaulis sp. TaxID=1969725 RepID=UPI003F9FE0E1